MNTYEMDKVEVVNSDALSKRVEELENRVDRLLQDLILLEGAHNSLVNRVEELEDFTLF